MKSGSSLATMAREIQVQHESKKDYVVGTGSLYLGGDKRLCMESENSLISFDASQQTHQQIAARLGIPSNYYQRMFRESPALLAENANHWFATNQENRMVRTIGSNARAFLSDRYLIIDNLDIIEAVFPVLEEMGLGKNIASCHLGEDKMFLKVVNPKVEAEIRKGDVVQSGFVISNSETGKGATAIQPLVYRLVCTNGLIAPESGLKKVHVGRKIESSDNLAHEFFSRTTLLAERELYLRQIVDVVRGISDPDVFDRIVQKMRDATQQPIIGKPHKAVEVLAQRVKLSEEETSGVLNHLLLAGDLSRYGMMNAVTRYSQDADSYDRATELEQLGNTVLSLPNAAWREISEATA